jgi:hypothetical protein
VSALVRRDAAEVRVSVRARPGLALPVAEGERVGQAVVRVDGREVGRVAAVVGELPDVAGPGRPWWVRVARVLVAVAVERWASGAAPSVS